MIPHWAPTILDGHAHYGRPRKPSRLIMVYFVHTAMACLGTLADQVAEGIGPTASPILLGEYQPFFVQSGNEETFDDESNGFARMTRQTKLYHSCQLILLYTVQSAQLSCGMQANLERSRCLHGTPTIQSPLST